MFIKKVSFLKSSSELHQLPKGKLPEFAFVGRSNVGKSSLINALCNRKKLAKVSGTPGKTQLINHFLVDDNWYLVDLPGYGYAKVSKKLRTGFSMMVSGYVQSRANLFNVFLLVDSRHEPLENDLDFMHFLGRIGIPFSIVFTKSDKLGLNKLNESVSHYKKVLSETWEELPPIFITSAEKKKGTEEILKYIGEVVKLVNKGKK